MALATFDEFKRTMLSESSLNRIREWYTLHDTGTITAFRRTSGCGNLPPDDSLQERNTIPEYDTIRTLKDNQSANKVLKAKLLSLGYGVTPVKGSWFEDGGKEVNEASFFVVDLKDSGNLKRDLIKLGTEYNQDAITYADKGGDYFAISTNKCPNSYPGFGIIGKEEKLGSPKFGKTGIYGFSKVNNRAFVFESAKLEDMSRCTINERNSILAMAGMLKR